MQQFFNVSEHDVQIIAGTRNRPFAQLSKFGCELLVLALNPAIQVFAKLVAYPFNVFDQRIVRIDARISFFL